MKELGRMFGYIAVTVVMIGVLTGIAKINLPDGSLAIAAIIVVVVVPVIIAIFMAKREKRNSESS